MLVKDFLNLIEEKIPLEIQDSWDNSGGQIVFNNQKLKNVLLSLDLTDDIIDKAIERESNLIINHHPLLFSGIKKIEEDEFKSDKIIKLIENKISVYALHTNLDLVEGGINDYFFQEMGWKSQGKISCLDNGYGYGNYGYVEGQSVKELAEDIKEKFNIPEIILYGDENALINKLGFLGGAGASFIDEALSKELDLYITSDIKHHDAMDAMEAGLIIMDLGHYHSEKHFNDLMEKTIEEVLGNREIEIIKADVDKKYIRKII